jgi:hypothetical protein
LSALGAPEHVGILVNGLPGVSELPFN